MTSETNSGEKRAVQEETNGERNSEKAEEVTKQSQQLATDFAHDPQESAGIMEELFSIFQAAFCSSSSMSKERPEPLEMLEACCSATKEEPEGMPTMFQAQENHTDLDATPAWLFTETSPTSPSEGKQSEKPAKKSAVVPLPSTPSKGKPNEDPAMTAAVPALPEGKPSEEPEKTTPMSPLPPQRPPVIEGTSSVIDAEGVTSVKVGIKEDNVENELGEFDAQDVPTHGLDSNGLDAGQQQQAKAVVQDFVKEMVRGREMSIMSKAGAIIECNVSLGRKLDSFKIQAGSKTRNIPLSDISDVHIGQDIPSNGTPVDDLSCTLALAAGDPLTFRFSDVTARDTFGMCVLLFKAQHGDATTATSAPRVPNDAKQIDERAKTAPVVPLPSKAAGTSSTEEPDAEAVELPGFSFDSKDSVEEQGEFRTQDISTQRLDSNGLSPQQQKQAKNMIKDFVKEMVRGQRMSVMSKAGAIRACTVFLGRKLDVLKIQAGSNARKIPLTDISDLHVGQDGPSIDTPLDDLCCTMALTSGECLTFKFSDIATRDNFARCMLMFQGKGYQKGLLEPPTPTLEKPSEEPAKIPVAPVAPLPGTPNRSLLSAPKAPVAPEAPVAPMPPPVSPREPDVEAAELPDSDGIEKVMQGLDSNGLSGEQRKQAKTVIKNFVNEMIRGRNMSVMNQVGAIRACTAFLSQKLDTFTIQAGNYTRKIPLTDISDLHVGTDGPGIDTPLDELCCTMSLTNGECLTFRFSDVTGRDTFSMCMLLFVNGSRRK